MSRIPGWILPLALLASGCARAPAPAIADVAAAPTNRESRVLCLAEPVGNPRADEALNRAQSIARQRQDAESWVAVGSLWVGKARLGSDPGFYLNADGCANEALATDSAFVPAQELRGLVLLNDHEFEQARLLATRILVQSPASALANGILSDALLEMGRYRDAARAAQAQMDAHPGMAANARAAHLNWLTGDTDSAELFIRDALLERDAKDPEAAAWVFVEAGLLHWHRGDYTGADAIFSEALRWLPDYPPALAGRGRVALSRGEAPAAIAALARAQRLRPLAETARLLGDAYALAGDQERARASYADAEQQGRRGDRLTLALLLTGREGGADEAMRLLEQERHSRSGGVCAGSEDCGSIYLDDAQAWALFHAGRVDEARRVSMRALRLGTRDARLIYHAGAIALAAGEAKHGRALLAQALALNPGFEFQDARQARALLAAASTTVARN